MKNILDKLHEKIALAKAGDQQTSKSIFFIMVGIIVLSICWTVLSKTVWKKEYKRPEVVTQLTKSQPLSGSFTNGIQSATSLMEVMSIKSSVDSLLVKDSLTSQDSLQLISALKRLEILEQQTK